MSDNLIINLSSHSIHIAGQIKSVINRIKL